MYKIKKVWKIFTNKIFKSEITNRARMIKHMHGLVVSTAFLHGTLC